MSMTLREERLAWLEVLRERRHRVYATLPRNEILRRWLLAVLSESQAMEALTIVEQQPVDRVEARRLLDEWLASLPVAQRRDFFLIGVQT